MSPTSCQLFETVLFALVCCGVVEASSVTQKTLRIADSSTGQRVWKTGVIGVLGVHRRRRRQQTQRPPFSDDSARLRDDASAIYRQSALLQNALTAFGLDITDLNYNVSDDTNSSIIRCLVVERVSLTSNDDSRQWTAERDVRKTVLPLSLHLVEFQIKNHAGQHSPNNATDSNDYSTRCLEAMSADLAFFAETSSPSTFLADSTAIYRTTVDDSLRRRRDRRTRETTLTLDDEPQMTYSKSAVGESIGNYVTTSDDWWSLGTSTSKRPQNDEYGLNRRQIFVISTTSTVIGLFCSVAMILRLRNFLKRNGLRYQDRDYGRRQVKSGASSTAQQHGGQQQQQQQYRLKPHQSILEFYTIATKPSSYKKN